MVAEITDDDFVAKPNDPLAADEAALAAAHAQATAELNRIREKASIEASHAAANPEYSIHSVERMGRYVIPRRTGWKALIDIIHDPVANIDFSANIYPNFDGIIGDHFQSPHLLDPLDDQYEAKKLFSAHPGRAPYEDLRDNIAAVRNFLMQTYYANTPEGMTPDKAYKSLTEIAAFVGDGLYNNWLFLNVIPNHNPTKPFIDLVKAQAPHGKGAQYIYEKILEHQRHSSWLRPFAPIMALFGGKSDGDWKLPSADETHFLEKNSYDILENEQAATQAELAAAAANVANIEAQLTSVRDSRMLTATALDLDAIGNHLLYTAQNLEQTTTIAQMSEPVRRDAVEIARDILRKLKLGIGELNLLDGLKMKPSDDMATLGAVKGVAMVYERLLAWARANHDSGIFQHPAIMAATQAIGQLGFLAKTEALRMATYAGNSVLAASISDQIKRLPAAYRSVGGATFGELLDHVDSGILTIINRTQQVGVTGAKVGFSLENNIGQSLSNAPTAGIANQVNVSQAAVRNAQAAQAADLAAQAQAQKIHSQMAAAAARAQQPADKAQTPPPSPPRSSTVGRQALGAANRAQQQQRSAATQATNTTTAPVTPAQQQAAARNATSANLARAARERAEHEHHLHEQQLQNLNQQKMAANAKAQAAANKIPTSMLKGFQNATSVKGATGELVTGGKLIDPKSIQASMAKPSTPVAGKPTATPDPNDPTKNPYVPPPPGAPRNTPGRGW